MVGAREAFKVGAGLGAGRGRVRERVKKGRTVVATEAASGRKGVKFPSFNKYQVNNHQVDVGYSTASVVSFLLKKSMIVPCFTLKLTT